VREIKTGDWRPLLFALAITLLALWLASGPQAQAGNRHFQTVPTPTPQTIPTPAREKTPRPPADETPVLSNLALYQSANPQDILPGEVIEFTLWLTNTSSAVATGIILVNPLDPTLLLQQVSATQGAVEVSGQAVIVHVGALEAGQTARFIIRARVSSEAQPGHIILSQATAHFDQGEALSNIAAAGLPPDVLPATGRERRGP
jgi:uncharacterized repeat protein (TIGR01451 family)